MGPDPGAASPSSSGREDPEKSAPTGRMAGGSSRFLLPLAWCVWLLVWLVPVLLVAPHAQTVRPWLEADTAPAALVAAATFFLVAIWPFWPALVSREPGRDAAHWIGASVLELAVLLALAAPFVLVAWSVGGRTLEAQPLVAAAMTATFFAMIFRLLAIRSGAAAVRWLILVATLLCAGPLIVVYAVGETIGADLPRVAVASPLVMAVWQMEHGWPSDLWLMAFEVTAWWALALGLAVAALRALWRRRKSSSKFQSPS